jgi:hypothetical protein
MKKTVALAALLAGLGGAASAATTILDFTADNAVSGSAGGTTYTVSATDALGTARTLSNTTHGVNLGCATTAWTFDCNPVGERYDVGFGVVGSNNGEVDSAIDNRLLNPIEYVQVKFDSLVSILGFAGMLAYNGSQIGEGTETVILEYSNDGGKTWGSVDVQAFNDDNDPDPTTNTNDTFRTVGLAWLETSPFIANAVRFTAGGQSPWDDKSANVTAAGLIVAPIPVPASLPLLLAGLGALGFAARRKQRKSA